MRAFVTGAGGQDGSYLCELLLDKGYKVVGLVRSSGDSRLQRLGRCLDYPDFRLVRGDIADPAFPYNLATESWDEVYLLAASTHVGQSFQNPTATIENNVSSTIRILDALYGKANKAKTRTYFAASSEMFGTMNVGEKANEEAPLAGQSPYAVSKVAGHLLCRVYRKMGHYVSSGIGFNHESCRRGEGFVTRKVGLSIRDTGRVKLGNLTSQRDWHHAKDTVRGMWMSIQPDEPGEYVFASGVPRSINDLVNEVCRYFKYNSEGAVTLVEVEKRPWDVEYLCGDASKAKVALGWEPTITWPQIIEDICQVRGVI